jgi:hypothetical protein
MISDHVDQYTLQGVYYLESGNNGMNPIAIRPVIQAHYIAWEDTGHGRSIRNPKVYFDDQEVKIPASPPKKLPEKIKIISDRGDFQLIKLTKKIFDEQLKNRVAGGESLNFKDDQAIQNYYLTADFG